MILNCRNQQEYDDALRILRVINELRRRGPGYRPPEMVEAPWIRNIEPKECYL